MRRCFLFGFLTLVLAAGLGLGQSRTLKVELTYKSDGEVNDNHRLWVFVWDTPKFTEGGVIPISLGSTSTNGGVIEIAGLTASPVYLTVMYDENGGYNAMGPPSSGSPVALHGDAMGPAPVELGENTEVAVAFDNSFRMP